jgi:hypothetical protein
MNYLFAFILWCVFGGESLLWLIVLLVIFSPAERRRR